MSQEVILWVKKLNYVYQRAWGTLTHSVSVSHWPRMNTQPGIEILRYSVIGRLLASNSYVVVWMLNALVNPERRLLTLKSQSNRDWCPQAITQNHTHSHSQWLSDQWMTQWSVNDSVISEWLSDQWMTQWSVNDSVISKWLSDQWMTQWSVNDSVISEWLNHTHSQWLSDQWMTKSHSQSMTQWSVND